MANDLLSSVFRALIVFIALLVSISFVYRWIKAGIGLIRDNEFKGFIGIEYKIAGFLMLLLMFMIVLMFIQGFLNR